MNFDFSKMFQAGGTAMLDIVNVEAPRFPVASIWIGNLAEWASGAARWLALPLGPLRLLTVAIYLRAHRARLSMMPLKQRLYIGAGVGLLTGLIEAFQQLGKKESS